MAKFHFPKLMDCKVLRLLYKFEMYRNRIPEAEFKEFEPRFKLKPRLKYGWFHLKLFSMFQDLILCLPSGSMQRWQLQLQLHYKGTLEYKLYINVFVTLNCLFLTAVFLRMWLTYFLLIKSNWGTYQNKHFSSKEVGYVPHFWPA